MEKHDNIMTATTGGYFNFTNPDQSRVSVVDIAHALSNICRFAGHVKEFYSVAEHSILVYYRIFEMQRQRDKALSKLSASNKTGDIMKQIDTPQTLMYALMHDAAEAFISDIPKPLKVMLPGIKEMEDKIFKTILDLLELDIADADVAAVKEADSYMLLKEAKTLLHPSSRFRHVWGPQISRRAGQHKSMLEEEHTKHDTPIRVMSSEEAEAAFLSIFNDLRWRRV